MKHSGDIEMHAIRWLRTVGAALSSGADSEKSLLPGNLAVILKLTGTQGSVLTSVRLTISDILLCHLKIINVRENDKGD